jgi:peroxiredoxin Q/BCP
VTRRFGLGVVVAALGLVIPGAAGPGAAAPPGSDAEYTKIVYIRVGDEAPAFQCVDGQGTVWKSSQHYGKKVVVVYFYMGDFFKDCVAQAAAYRSEMNALKAAGAEVVGISGDSPANHERFRKAYRLPQTLLSDPEAKVGDVWGVAMSGGGDFQMKDADGSLITIARGCTPTRWTFVVGRDGKVIYKNTNVKAANDAREVLEAIEKYNNRKVEK